MNQASLIGTLKEMGLTEKTATIYASLLGKRKMTVSEISRETGVKRATCYEHIDELLNKELITRIPVGKRMFYAALEPKKILGDFKKKTALFEEKINEMSRIHDAAQNKPRVVFYEGKREIKNIYEDLSKNVGDTYSIFPPAAFFENFTEEDYSEFDALISTHGLKARDLLVSDKYYKKIKEIRDRNPSTGKLGKKLPNWFTCNVNVLIYSEKVALISLRDLSAVVIENKDIADLFRNMHTFMWKSV